MDKQTSRGVSKLSPHLVITGAADAITFYKKAFGATELMRLEGQDGKLMHACILVNGSSVMLVDENREWKALSPKTLGGTPVTIHLMVDDVDATHAKAVAAGARVVMPPTDMFWGDRYGVVEDPFGHSWSIATTKKVMTEAEIKAAAQKAMSGEGVSA
ncbi:MAG TPA: VOC family protein [Xanthobacteraceae bacterium]|nr:VOC family protein [Xanthobacteraceae bacterium]